MSTNPVVLAQLTAFKAEGLSPAAAAGQVMQTNAPAPSANALSQELTVVFSGITAAELALILHAQFPSASALEVAQAVLQGLPNTNSATMYAALVGAGFAAVDANGAVNLLFPVTVTIQSTQPWQTTGVTITGTQSTAIACSGSWTSNPAIGMCGPNGDGAWIAPAQYTLAGAPEGAMIGQVGTNPPFLVGAAGTAPAGQSGTLSLCINDDLKGVYGAGLTDNVGTMNVVVTTTP